jgi:flagellar hook-basal body complex protein FliE
MTVEEQAGNGNRGVREMLAAMNQIASVAAGGPAGLAGGGKISPGILKEPKQAGSEEQPFANLLGNAVGQVSRLEDDAQKAVMGLMTGSGVDVHQAMIATEKASMAFELSLAVRNKAIQAYQQVMSMQF